MWKRKNRFEAPTTDDLGAALDGIIAKRIIILEVEENGITIFAGQQYTGYTDIYDEQSGHIMTSYRTVTEILDEKNWRVTVSAHPIYMDPPPPPGYDLYHIHLLIQAALTATNAFDIVHSLFWLLEVEPTLDFLDSSIGVDPRPKPFLLKWFPKYIDHLYRMRIANRQQTVKEIMER